MSSTGCRSCGHENPSEARFCANCGSALNIAAGKPVPAEMSAAPEIAVEYMGFGIRFVAALIDGLILLAVFFAIRGVVPFFIILAPLLYFWLFTSFRGQTPGKMIVGIRVVNADGNVPGLGYAALREVLGKCVSTLVILVGFFWITWNYRKRALHDLIAGTFVVRVPPKR